MSNKSNLGKYVRGGQTFSLNVNMFVQNIKSQIKYIGLFVALICITIAYFSTTKVEQKWAYQWSKAYVISDFLGWKGKTTTLLINKRETEVPYSWIVKQDSIVSYKNSFVSKIENASLYSIFICLLFVFLHTRYLVKSGDEAVEDEHVRGATIGTKKELIKASLSLIKTYKKERGKSTLSVCGIPLVQGSETAGIATVGSPGVGKTETHIDIAKQFRDNKNKAMIYDVGGEMAKLFYREGYDIILNPYDKRCPHWDVWSEGRSKQQYASISEALVPDDGNDPIWYQAPRKVLTQIMKKLGDSAVDPEMSHLQRILFQMDSKKLAGVLADTDAKSSFNEDAEKMAGSILSIMSTYADCLSLLQSGEDNFSITDWVNNEEDDRWVFVTCREVERATLSPLITVWFEIFAKAVLSLESSYSRRIAGFIDEIPTLQKIPSLSTLLNTGRKKGFVPVLGYQAKSQMEETYGEKLSDSIINAIPTYLVFRCNGINGAESSSKELGNMDLKQASEGSTVGQTDSRDAQSLNRQNNSDRRLVMASEIQGLQDLECYIRLSRGLPISKVQTTKHKMKPTGKSFEPRDNEDLIRGDSLSPMAEVNDIDAYLDSVEKRVEEEEALKNQVISNANKSSNDGGEEVQAKVPTQSTQKSSPVVM